MNERERFVRMMSSRSVDRPPVFHWKGWPETRRRWIGEGMPPDADESAFFGAPPIRTKLGLNVNLFPAFEEEELEREAESRLIRQADGVIARHWNDRSCIPHFVEYTLSGSRGWDEYRARLQPHPDRIPSDLDARIEAAHSSESPVSIETGSLIGWLRNWMGVEQLAYLAYDDRALLREMVDTIADLVCDTLSAVLPRITPDIAWGWEDICFRTGPLISPSIFEDVAVPAYARISALLREHGCGLYLVDCDGMIDALLPHWLAAGVNVMFPLEIGAWHADPAEYRRRFGPELLIYGGIDKLALERGRDAIDAEIARRVPLMREGGFVPLPDHLITPDTPLDDYRYYLDRLRAVRL